MTKPRGKGIKRRKPQPAPLARLLTVTELAELVLTAHVFEDLPAAVHAHPTAGLYEHVRMAVSAPEATRSEAQPMRG